MASVNEGFVPDDDVKERGQLEHQSDSPVPLKKLDDVLDITIDYSAARKPPLFIAAIAGKSFKLQTK